MKFSLVTLSARLDFASRLRENDFTFSAKRGWTLTLADGGVLASHAELEAPEWVPLSAVARATVAPEEAAKGKAK